MSPATEKSSTAAGWYTIGQMRAWEKNPKKHPDSNVADIARSVRRFGFVAPVVVWGSRGQIVAGHGRYLAAQMILRADPGAYLATDAPGPALIPVRVVEFASDAEASAYALADNRLTEANPMEPVDVAAILKEIQDAGGDVEVPGWTEAEIAAMLGGQEPEPDGTGGEDAGAGEPPAEPVSRVGEVYELGPHRLVCGDCRDASDVAMLLAGAKINLAFTSPPYAQQREYDESSGFKPIPPDEYVAWFDAVQANVRAHIAPDGSWFVNIKEGSAEKQRSLYCKDLVIAHVRQWKWLWIDELCWLRQSLPGDPNSMGKFKNGFEPVYHFAASKDFRFRPESVQHESERFFEYKTQKAAGAKITSSSQGKGRNAQSPVGYGHGLAYPSNVLDITEGARVEGHPAAFPVDFPAFFVRAYTDPGDTVYEPFCGSGTTLIAAAKERRICYGMEISPRYCDVIRRRWTKYAISAGVDPGPGRLDA